MFPQVQHIFSDKTGTLTENKMLFRRCTVNGIDYNHPPSELEENIKPNSPAPPVQTNAKLLEDMCLTDQMQNFTIHSQRIQEFFLVLSICNTVVVSATPHRDIMNASGMIECQDDVSVTVVKPMDSTNGSTAGHTGGKSKVDQKHRMVENTIFFISLFFSNTK